MKSKEGISLCVKGKIYNLGTLNILDTESSPVLANILIIGATLSQQLEYLIDEIIELRKENISMKDEIISIRDMVKITSSYVAAKRQVDLINEISQKSWGDR